MTRTGSWGQKMPKIGETSIRGKVSNQNHFSPDKIVYIFHSSQQQQLFMMTIGYIRMIILITPSASCIIAMVNSFQLNYSSPPSSASSIRNFSCHTRPFPFRANYPRRNNKRQLLFQSLNPRDGSNNNDNDNDYYLSQQQASQSPPATTTTTGAAFLITNDESYNAMTSTAAGGGGEDEAINHYNNYDPVSATADADAEDGRTEIIGDWFNFGGSNNADINSHPPDDGDNGGDDDIDYHVNDYEIDDDDYDVLKNDDNISTIDGDDDDRNNVDKYSAADDMTTFAMGVTEFVNQIGGNDNVYDDKYENNNNNNNKYNNNAAEMTTPPPPPADIDTDDIQIAIDALTTMDIPHEVLLNINGEPIEVIVPNNGVVVVTTSDMDVVEDDDGSSSNNSNKEKLDQQPPLPTILPPGGNSNSSNKATIACMDDNDAIIETKEYDLPITTDEEYNNNNNNNNDNISNSGGGISNNNNNNKNISKARAEFNTYRSKERNNKHNNQPTMNCA
jgi:hypothetical protein